MPITKLGSKAHSPGSVVACLFDIVPVAVAAWCVCGRGETSAPRPLPDHPGNVFLTDEAVAAELPPGNADEWRLLNYEGTVLARGSVGDGRVNLGKLPVGWYELVRGDDSTSLDGRRSLAVLEPLKARIPATSPIALDVAMAWFYDSERMAAAASLCSLAGVNWVRDRLNWAEMEPDRGRFSGPNRYDQSAKVQAAAGLRDLQVMHSSPRWANPETKRFPLDLRDGYRFYREIARRWRGWMRAFEPWNEADIEVFGGHTGAEIASLQKAAWLGLKAGNPALVVCQNVFAVNQPAILDDFRANRAWPYFDTFNFHHYIDFDAYPRWYTGFRAASAGRPLWVTECNLPVKWTGDGRFKEPAESDLRVQAERVAKVFATSLHERPAMVFYFLFPHYVEGQTQFGIVRPDLTPRPAYVALATAGRLLADAQALGRIRLPEGSRAYWFSARPDGRRREIIVAWADVDNALLELPAPPVRVFDHLGRNRESGGRSLPLSSAPLFVEMPVGSHRRALVDSPPEPAERLEGKPSPVVFQARWPTARVRLQESAYKVQVGKTETVPLRIYNFSRKEVRGTVHVETSPGWKADMARELYLAPENDIDAELSVVVPSVSRAGPGRVTITGEFGRIGRAVFSLRLQPE